LLFCNESSGKRTTREAAIFCIHERQRPLRATRGRHRRTDRPIPANARAYSEEIVLPQWAAAVAAGDARAAERLRSRISSTNTTIQPENGGRQAAGFGITRAGTRRAAFTVLR
jgi:hypothetical protein